jgi:hypothetical protein
MATTESENSMFAHRNTLFLVPGALAALVFLSGCPTEKGYPPVARMKIEPRYVPVSVDTDVLLDGKRSCDEVDHPESCDKSADGSGPSQSCPAGVTFRWTLDRSVHLLAGGPDHSWMRVRVNTDRPINVTLKVTDCDGEKAEVRGQIGVILPSPGASP